MRWFRWFLNRPKPGPPFGVCAHCGVPLQECPACEGRWRGSGCACGLGLRCPAHGRHWS